MKTSGNRQKSEVIFSKGKMFELVHIKQPDGRIFEIARRAPGARLIIADKEKRQVLLTKEFRHELGGLDYRLPGGKVFDTLDEYNSFLSTGGDIHEAAQKKAKGEGREEAGIDVTGLHEYRVSTLGATIEWDLFVFECTDWKKSENGQQLESGEEIETDNWFTYEETEKMIIEGEMREERIALVLLQWLKTQGGEDEV